MSAHEDVGGRDETKASSERSFGLVFAVVLGVLAPLRRRFEPEAESYRIERRPPGPAPESMRHQF